MNKLSWEQRRAFAGFFGNFAVAWFAGGIVGPYLAGNLLYSAEKIIASLFWGGVSLVSMLYFTKGGKK